MILYEFEGKELLKKGGIAVPPSQLISHAENDSGQARMTVPVPLVLKAQVLSGKRAEVGGIVIVETEEEFATHLKELFGKVINKETVEKVLVEEKVEIEKEYYISLSFDTDTRSIILSVSQAGGTGIEERVVQTFPINILDPMAGFPASELLGIPKELITKIVQLFIESDALLIEINPLVFTRSGEWVALDAKIKLDDTAAGRHQEDWQYSPRSVPGYIASDREIAAKKIDETDYRGTAGSTYFDLEGDIAVLASGGGGSLTAMDALLKVGGKPANYTEYSGNPPREKVEKLTEIVLSKPGIHALWVVGAIANLTDIYETLSGFIEGLQSLKQKGVKLDFPIVIRRAGPRDSEAFEMLKKIAEFNIMAFGTETSISQAAEKVNQAAKEYAEREGDKK